MLDAADLYEEAHDLSFRLEKLEDSVRDIRAAVHRAIEKRRVTTSGLAEFKQSLGGVADELDELQDLSAYIADQLRKEVNLVVDEKPSKKRRRKA